MFTAAAAVAESLQLCPTLCDPMDGSPPGSPVPGILRQEHWSGLAFPSPMHEHCLLNVSRFQLREGNGTPLQYSCLESPMDGGAWWAAVHGVARSWT